MSDKLALLKDTKACSRCRKFEAVWTGSKLRSWAAARGVAMKEADWSKDQAAYRALVKELKVSGRYALPYLAVVSGGKAVLTLQPSPLTADALIRKIEKACPSCAQVSEVKYKTCPHCGGSGKVEA